ncbi:FAS-associated factor 2 [Phlyctochytrium bullatum]|nr:FAS-associated factor 2 [Phlyctochytrium bullatum]
MDDIDKAISMLNAFDWQLEPRRRASTNRRRNLQSSDPQAAAARFLLDFEAAYGRNHPTFFQGTYSQALDVAKRELRYLLVYLQSSDHDDTPVFNRNTLTSERLIKFLVDGNYLVWAGDIKESESFLVSNVLLATRYPFIALIAPQGSRMVVVDRLEGPSSPEELIAAITHHSSRFDSNLQAIRADRERQDQARKIREQQDQAYQASLKADQEKERKAREERERLQREKEEEERIAREAENRIEAKKRRKEELRQNLGPEPPASAKDVAKVSIRLPSGERIVRRFLADDKLEILYDFIESLDLSPIPIEADVIAVNTYPRKTLLDRSQSLREAGLFPNASLIIEEKDDDEDADDE